MSGTASPQTANEQTRLTANALNNLAVAMAVAGFIAPAASGQMTTAGRFIAGLVWLSIAYGVHMAARLTLRGLKP